MILIQEVYCGIWELLSKVSLYTVIQLGLLVVAGLALNTWRKQLHGGNEYQTAFDLLLRVRQLEKKIQKEIRNPFLRPVNNKSFDDWNWEREVYMSRFNDFYDFKNKFYDEAVLKSEILFGKDIELFFKNIEDRIVEIRMAYEVAYKIFRGRDKYDDESMYRQYAEKIEKNKELLWNQDGDNYSVRLRSAVKALEEVLYKKMNKKI
ncbi:MAG: hypothetical protein HYT28_01965 [Parcubacteria group bacterium]|nr:hypothetical protein [Parcubacteria group bacterium]